VILCEGHSDAEVAKRILKKMESEGVIGRISLKVGFTDVDGRDNVPSTYKELEGEMGDVQIGLQARLMSQALRKLVSIIGRTQTIIIFTNQFSHYRC
jgi:DNA-binding Lrp family transcriptional regulator